MKKIFSILIGLAMCFTFSSCITTATAQIDDMYDDVDVNLVITYGTPYYNTEGLLLYYIYRDMFYYPYIYNNTYYFHRYYRPLPPNRAWRYKPLPRDFYKHRPHHNYDRANHHHPTPNHHHNNGGHHSVRPNSSHSPNISYGNINRGGHTRMVSPRSSTRATVGRSQHSSGRRR